MNIYRYRYRYTYNFFEDEEVNYFRSSIIVIEEGDERLLVVLYEPRSVAEQQPQGLDVYVHLLRDGRLPELEEVLEQPIQLVLGDIPLDVHEYLFQALGFHLI
jgi:hypothetical protein